MAALPAQLDPKAVSPTGRTARRRKLRLQAQGAAASGAADVLILDVSTTGLLFETRGELTNGETIELDIPEAGGTRAVVKWKSGLLFGCQFTKPISAAAVSAALLRASYEPRGSSADLDLARAHDPAAPASQPGSTGDVSRVARLWSILALAILSWAMIAAAVSIAWRFVR
jgi:hypothetical protein